MEELRVKARPRGPGAQLLDGNARAFGKLRVKSVRHGEIRIAFVHCCASVGAAVGSRYPPLSELRC
ncbi:hypothetical protein SDC9_97674 [bioreactor metagenome]|uniref:Uncharacterized protein n=1 Tax=bioreactor metagenome TaxID=1076179 RepID=A0A645ADZ9_9ZZZZ